MKLIFLASDDRSLYNFRAPLIRALKERGHEVIACAPLEDPAIPGQMQEIGALFHPIPIRRTGLNVLADFAGICRLFSLLKLEKPDVLLCSAIKPIIYGSLLGRAAGVPRRFALVPGLGSAFSGKASRGLKLLVHKLYRIAFRQCNGIFTQNPDIADYFVKTSLARLEQIIPVRGSGVDLKHYAFRHLAPGDEITFLMLSRLLGDKGINEYAEAARRVRMQHPKARFRLAGAVDPNPSALPLDRIMDWDREGLIEYIPYQKDVRPLLESCSVLVLPSYYMEGIPRSILEAMAIGRPIITTDFQGCRETIVTCGKGPGPEGSVQGENGFLVPIRSVKALAEAMDVLVSNHGLLVSMGKRSRELAEAEFDAVKVSRKMVDAIEASLYKPLGVQCAE